MVLVTKATATAESVFGTQSEEENASTDASAAISNFWQGPGRDLIFEVSKFLPRRAWLACREVSRDWKIATDHQRTLDVVFERPTTLQNALTAARIDNNYFRARHRSLNTPEMPEPCSVTFASGGTLLAVGAREKVYLGKVDKFVECPYFERALVRLFCRLCAWRFTPGGRNAKPYFCLGRQYGTQGKPIGQRRKAFFFTDVQAWQWPVGRGLLSDRCRRRVVPVGPAYAWWATQNL